MFKEIKKGDIIENNEGATLIVVEKDKHGLWLLEKTFIGSLFKKQGYITYTDLFGKNNKIIIDYKINKEPVYFPMTNVDHSATMNDWKIIGEYDLKELHKYNDPKILSIK